MSPQPSKLIFIFGLSLLYILKLCLIEKHTHTQLSSSQNIYIYACLSILVDNTATQNSWVPLRLTHAYMQIGTVSKTYCLLNPAPHEIRYPVQMITY